MNVEVKENMGRLLLVDDDEAFNRILGRALRSRGFDVVAAESVAEARELIEKHEGQAFDFALIDLNLKGVSGLPLVPAVMASSPYARVVVLTGYASIVTAIEAIKLGAVHYLAKPADVDDIVRSLTNDGSPDEDLPPDQPMSVSQVAWEHIQRVLAENDGNISATARALGMHRRTLQRKLAKKQV